jgi:hypothetical protein
MELTNMADIPIAEIEVFAGAAFSELKVLPARLAPNDPEMRERLEAAIANLVRVVTEVLIARLRESMLREIDGGTAH